MMRRVKKLFDPDEPVEPWPTVSPYLKNTDLGPRQFDLDRCVHCGLCLNACPTYRELGLEMDSPRGRVYQMVQVANGAPITPSYIEHIDLCLACRGCESACPSGVRYGQHGGGRAGADRSAAAARLARRAWCAASSSAICCSRAAALTVAGTMLYLYEASGLKALVRGMGFLKLLGRLGDLEQLAPSAEPPFFFSQIGKTFPAEGERRYRVAFLAAASPTWPSRG